MPNVKSIRLASLLTVALLGSCAEEPGGSDGLLVANVNVVDVATKQIHPNKNILIRDGRIVRIVDGEEAAAYRDRYDARGAFATAGLYDAHVHIDTAARLELMLPLTHAVSLMAQHEVSLTPNLVAYREIADQIRNVDETLARKDWALTPPIARVYATPPFNGYVNDFGGDDIRERAIAHFTRTAKAMDSLTFEAHQPGVMILAGSDVGNPTMFAGQALYREMKLLKDAGLDGYDAIAAATLNVAKLFGEENERGSVAAGKVADLVLFRVNPVDHGGLTRSDVAAVIKDGVLFDQERIAAETAPSTRPLRSERRGTMKWR